LTWKFFRNGASSRKIERAEEFSDIIGEWLDNPDSYARERASFLRLRYEEDPTMLIDELVALANEVAGAKPRRRAFPPNGNG
jgi:processive 1,2-diacylglycerol beta-glucosyltransferase